MDSSFAIVLLVGLGLGVGALIGWLAARPALTRLRGELEKDRALHDARLVAYEEAEGAFREAFEALSAKALNRNNETFLALAETRLGQTRTATNADIDARKKAIEDLLAPMAKTL